MRQSIVPLLLVSIFPLCAYSAGGHYPVDDADIGHPGDFGVESWFTHVDSDNSEFAFLPTWRPGNLPLELVGGLIRVEEDGESVTRIEPAAKWQFSPREGAEAEYEGQLGLRFHVDAAFESFDIAVGRELTGDDEDWFFTAGFGLAF